MGSQLEDLEVQVIDENGTVDNLMEGFPHSLTIDWNFEASLPLHHGACRLPAITLPAMPGTWHGRVAHAFHPELFFVIEVPRPKTIQLTYKSYPLTQCEFSSGVHPLWLFTTCFAYKINTFFPLVVHAWRLMFEFE